jgi:predicted dehydrogenase
MDGSPRPCTRREAIRRIGGAGAALAAPALIPSSALGADGATPPSDRIRLGAIGINGMGGANLGACAGQKDVVVTALCDCWQERLDRVLAKHAGTAKGYRDYRELLASKDVDAVIIATPPHWHCLMAVHAAEAGKDIYLQKPMTMYPDETLAVRNAVRKHKRICQVGTQIHAGSNYRRVVEWIRSGKLGPVGNVRVFWTVNQGKDGIGKAPKQDPPAGLDWNLWLGPAPAIPYNSLLAASAWHHCSFWDYSGGWTPGMAPHLVDLPIWALDLGVPLVTHSAGGRFAVGGDGDAPDTQEVLWQYPNLVMTWMFSIAHSFGFDFGRGKPEERRMGVYFHGANGTLLANYDRLDIAPEGNRLADASPPPPTLPPSPGHEREWLTCIKTRQEPSCGVNYHYKIDLAVTLANLSYKLGRSVRFDDKTEKILGDAEAARRARPAYRDPWKFPAGYLG